MPGLGFSPFLLAISSAISWPCIGFFESKKRIRNLTSLAYHSNNYYHCHEQIFSCYTIICWSSDIYKKTEYYISYIRYVQGVDCRFGLWMLWRWISKGKELLTKEERIALLKEYQEELEKEKQGISERIKALEQINRLHI